MPIELILGGARSGKSGFAENRVREIVSSSLTFQPLELNALTSKPRTMHYVATSEALDEEMLRRIEHHKQQRGEGWIEWECPCDLVSQLKQFDESDVVLIDCLTLWLNNVIYYQGQSSSNARLEHEIEMLAMALQQSSAHIILVSNEVGMGVVPMGEVSRLFVDNAGRMNQALARIAQQVVLVAAGLPLTLKSGK
ncbi:bifunctional adenosylcobinamide kinase/adenosylcobinamide-phosphate guanylyltransferase [Vibrio methylphosphonaticus]|uniref:bifunctional adenosylcobinamide kinase/adenosylcobinamide-phosphate guanylyltransferase n=1 Tax=Vibrio methylphosphonaticus TaxID=2946866 RepID=UPI00202A05FF|nr:bifunctional adenosylcobinamide kinase/adenosylcobinamide-phosphate guanylyltransferase [Vibrio methylphosphonaticus]MCL9774795.1 bifunctional adenosylcobinamide kinase/adenosylcobinamide-phosphate guanylyltransferase [Vibrio methylphosphonaticus]